MYAYSYIISHPSLQECIEYRTSRVYSLCVVHETCGMRMRLHAVQPSRLTGGAGRVAEERNVARLRRDMLRARGDAAAGALELRHVQQLDAARLERRARAGAQLRLVRRGARLARLQLAGAGRVHEHHVAELRLAVLARVRAHVAQQRLHLREAVAHDDSHASCTHETCS